MSEDAYKLAILELRDALHELAIAAENRDNTMGDPCRLIEVRGNLGRAARRANEVLAKTDGIWRTS